MPHQAIPFAELYRQFEVLGFRRANFAEMRAGMLIAEQLTGQPMTSPETITWLDSLTGMAAWVFGDPVEGVFITVPVSALGVAAIRDGSFVPSWPALAHIATEGEPCHGIYIGVYAGATKAARKALMTASAVIRVEVFAAVPCFARGATDDGRRSMTSLGFRPVEGGLPDLYVHEALVPSQEKAA